MSDSIEGQKPTAKEVVTQIMAQVVALKHAHPVDYGERYKEIETRLYDLVNESKAASQLNSLVGATAFASSHSALESVLDCFRPKVEVRERLIPIGLPDGEEPIVREEFEACIREMNFPLKRQGYSYRSPFTAHGWSMVFCVVNKIRNRLMDAVKAEEKRQHEQSSAEKAHEGKVQGLPPGDTGVRTWLSGPD